MGLFEEYNYKFAAPKIKTESTIRQGYTPKLVVAVNSSNNASQIFVQALDKVLQRLSGFERVEITALDALKDSSIIKSMGIPVPGAILIRGKESAVVTTPTENAMMTFFNKNQKLWRN